MNADQKCVTLNFFNWLIIAVCLAIHWYSLYQCRGEESEDRKKEGWSDSEDLWAGGQSRHCFNPLIRQRTKENSQFQKSLSYTTQTTSCFPPAPWGPPHNLTRFRQVLLCCRVLVLPPAPTLLLFKTSSRLKHLTDFKRHSVSNVNSKNLKNQFMRNKYVNRWVLMM